MAAIDNTIALSSHLNWEQRLGFVRESSYSYFAQSVAGGNFGVGAGYAQDPNNPISLVAGLPGLTINNFSNQDQYSSPLLLGPASAFTNMGYYQNRLNPSTNLILVAGKHTLVVGGGYSYTQLNVTNNRNGLTQVTVGSFENLLKDKVKSSNVTPVTRRTSGRRGPTLVSPPASATITTAA